MEIKEDYKLEDIELQDIEDTLASVAKSFKITLPSDAFLEVKTFGDICETFRKNIQYEHEESCTAQQAFYKVRNAIAVSQKIGEDMIRPNTQLKDIFPVIGRRKRIRAFQKELAIPITLLNMKTWLMLSIIIGFVISLAAFFFSWKVALTGILGFIIINWVATKLQQEIEDITIRELVKNITTKHYLQARRNPNTINKNEILKVIQCNFISDHDLKLSELHHDARLGLY